MGRIKGIFWFWAAVIGAELFAAGVVCLVLALSPVLRERLWESLLLPNSPLLRAVAAERLRLYPSKAAAISLVAMLNLQGKSGAGQDAAEEALSSLRELSGEPFQPGWTDGDAYDVPTSPEAWSETVSRVNAWAFNAFGPDALADLAKLGLTPDANFTITTSTGGNGSLTLSSSAGNTAEVSFPLPDGGKLTLAFGDTSGLAERLNDAGVAMDSRFARAMMSGDSVAFRAILTGVVEDVKNGDTAEAAVIFGFLGQPVPRPAEESGNSAGSAEDGATEGGQ